MCRLKFTVMKYIHHHFTNSIQKHYNTHKEPSAMKTYLNPNCRKIKGSHNLLITCAYCKTFISKYQKVGETNLVKMYNERIIERSIDFSPYKTKNIIKNSYKSIKPAYFGKKNGHLKWNIWTPITAYWNTLDLITQNTTVGASHPWVAIFL